MPIQGLKFNIPSSGERHLSFQATGSFTSYNPNDGYALIALDRTATLLDYDHKLPSQSGGHFPGPINSYLSIFYLDQSGAGVAGQIIVYASPDTVQIPTFWSIGRAVQSQVTAVDLVIGTQPGNPPANSVRMWVDAQGDLHLLDSAGVDNEVLDQSNFAGYVQPLINATTLGGYLRGTIANAIISVPNNNWVFAKNSVGTEVTWMLPASDNVTYIQSLSPTTGISFRRSDATFLMTISSTGRVTATDAVMTGGAYYLINTSVALSWDGPNGSIVSTHFLTAPYFNVPAAGYSLRVLNSTNTSIYLDGSTTGLTQFNNAGTQPTWRYLATVGPNNGYYFDFTLNSPAVGMTAFGGNANKIAALQFVISNSSFAYMALGRSASEIGANVHFYSQGNIYAVSDVSGATITNRSSRKIKEGIVPLDSNSLIARIRDSRVNPVGFRWNWEEMKKRQQLEPLPPHSLVPRNSHLGFIAEEMEHVVPEAVSWDSTTGEASGINYGILTAVLWGAVRNLDDRLTALGG